MSAIAELDADRVVEGVYAVARKRRLRTKSGAAYLALELVDPSGRIEARVWNDVELLDGRFDEGDAVRVLGRVERFRDRLQLDVRALEAAPDADPAGFAPALRRDPDELDGFLEFLAGEISHPGLNATVGRFAGDPAIRAPAAGAPGRPGRPPRLRRRTARAHGRRGDDLPRALPASPAPSRRPAARRRAVHDVGRTVELAPGPGFRQTEEGRLLGHVHLGLRLIEDRAGALDAGARAELLHAVARTPRRAGREDRRSRRPVPREPTRRGRRHAAG